MGGAVVGADVVGGTVVGGEVVDVTGGAAVVVVTIPGHVGLSTQ
ncbi:MAG: hypothetical protein AB7G88_06510 [Thermomicrobiales bacterium]